MKTVCMLAVGALLFPGWLAAARKQKPDKAPETSELTRYLASVRGPNAPGAAQVNSSPGSLWSPTARLLDAGADLRASRPGDLVTVVVEEQSSAIAQGTTKTTRSSSAQASAGPLAGKTWPALNALAKASMDRSIDGNGVTTRGSSLSATLTAQVTEVLPNGFLLIEGSKQIVVNSESQLVTVRGLIRPFDVSAGNLIPSDRVAMMEIKVNGKGVVNDVVRRPNILYRILLGILPF